MVRVKFVCTLKNEIALTPVYVGSKENEQFFRATPGGQIILNIVNPEAAAAFEQSKEYYVDFSPATDPEQPKQVQTTEVQNTVPQHLRATPTEPQTAPQHLKATATKQPELKQVDPQQAGDTKADGTKVLNTK